MTQTDRMTQTARKIYILGLRNAHAMEIQARELMERQSERLTDYPEVLEKVRRTSQKRTSSSSASSCAWTSWAKARPP
jgi:ferritin-like metal-binding protein YciE